MQDPIDPSANAERARSVLRGPLLALLVLVHVLLVTHLAGHRRKAGQPVRIDPVAAVGTMLVIPAGPLAFAGANALVVLAADALIWTAVVASFAASIRRRSPVPAYVALALVGALCVVSFRVLSALGFGGA